MIWTVELKYITWPSLGVPSGPQWFDMTTRVRRDRVTSYPSRVTVTRLDLRPPPPPPAGVMRLEDLSLVFKSSTCAPADAKSYIISLLDKFEVAVTWDSRTLLIPSLLPSEEMLRGGVPGMDVRVKVRGHGRAGARRQGRRYCCCAVKTPAVTGG